MAKDRDDGRVSGEVRPGERREAVGPAASPWGGGREAIDLWTSGPRNREVVLRIFRGEPLELISRELGLELYRLEKWRDASLAGMEEALKARNGDSLKGALDNAMKRLGELTMENELLWARVRRPGSLAKRRSKK